MSSQPPRPTTPPSNPAPPSSAKSPLTPEQVRRIETNRLKAKALYEARKAAEAAGQDASSAVATTDSTGKKRPFSAISPSSRKGGEGRESINIRPARKFTKYVEYDLSNMTDTKGGFMSTDDDPHSILAAENLKDKPKGMTLEEWSRHQLRIKLQREKQGAYAPVISALDKKDPDRCCFECGAREIDWKWLDVFKCRVCEKCKKEKPEKYSLLTKTEAREDYMLTDPELRDAELLPHLEQPNPHKSTWSNMMLYLKYQLEERAEKKWGGFEAMDAEFEKRAADKRRKNENKFKSKLQDLKKKTRVEQWKRNRPQKHEHVWGTAVVKGDSGETVRTCEECGFEIEELVF